VLKTLLSCNRRMDIKSGSSGVSEELGCTEETYLSEAMMYYRGGRRCDGQRRYILRSKYRLRVLTYYNDNKK
jgi:hypothetical protein